MLTIEEHKKQVTRLGGLLEYLRRLRSAQALGGWSFSHVDTGVDVAVPDKLVLGIVRQSINDYQREANELADRLGIDISEEA